MCTAVNKLTECFQGCKVSFTLHWKCAIVFV